MPSAYSVPMASDVLPEPDTPTTATIRHSGTSTSTSRRLLWRAPRTPMTVGRVPGTETGLSGIPGNLTPACQRVLCRAAGRRSRQSCTGPLCPRSSRHDCMIWNVVVRVNSSMSAAASTPVYFAMTGAAARSVTVSRWALTPAQTFGQ